MNEFLKEIQPALVMLALAVISGCAAVATAYFRCVANKINESKDREALHSALKTGAEAGRKKLKGTTAAAKDDKAVVAYAVDYATKSVPGAIKRLKPSDEVMGKLALSKIEETAVTGVG